MSKIKDLPKFDRPREKFEKYGPQRMTDVELLALLLGSGTKGKPVMNLSKEIIRQIQKLGVANVRREDLKKIKGLGDVKVSQILATIELGKRLQNKDQNSILSPEDVWKLCIDIRDSKKEHFVAFYLDSRNKLIERQIISVGTLNASLVHPREVFEPAIRLSAASVIIAHNHPSGDIEPSPEDKEVTSRLREAGKILGIRLINHIILTNNHKKAV